MTLGLDLEAMAAIDQHAHNILTAEAAAQIPYVAAFSESPSAALLTDHAPHTLGYRRSLRDMGALLDCATDEASVLAQRQSLGLEALTRRCFEAAHLKTIILDDGFLPDAVMPWHWHQQFVPVRRLIRLEYLAEQLIAQVDRFDVFLEWFRSELDPLPESVVGFKSIAAYRVGLDIQWVDQDLAEDAFYDLKLQQAHRPPEQRTTRLVDKVLIDFLLLEALAIANQHAIPIQFHTGFGDPDLDLRLANPLHLRPILAEPQFQNAPIVLLHGSYPFSQEAGFLASVYPQVYVDFGLAIPSLSVRGMAQVIHQLLELAPTSKVMYSSDAHLIPDLFYLGAKWGRRSLGRVLTELVEDGDLSAAEAEAVAIAILHDNAQRIYRL